MNKLKSLFKKDKDDESTSSTSHASTGYTQQQSAPTGSTAQPTATSFPPNDAPSTGLENAKNPQGVVLHTTLGDITVALFAKETPRVRIHSE